MASPPPDLKDWASALTQLYPHTITPDGIDYLPGISDPRFSLEAFKLHWLEGLQHGNFPSPLITQAEQQDVDNFLSQCITKGILEEAPEPSRLMLHPTILIPKKQPGQLRLVVDFRPTNRMFSPFPFDITDRATLLRSIPSGMHYFTVLDISDAFYQIRIDTSTLRNFFGIHIRNKFFRFTRLPQGWKNSPSICQMVYQSILGDLLNSCTCIYMDDILIYSQTLADHWKHLNMVLKKLHTFRVRLNWAKATVAQPAVEYLGILISHRGLQPSKDILSKLSCFIQADLTTTSHWQKARGLLLQYQHFGPRVHDLASEFRQATTSRRTEILHYLASLQTNHISPTTQWNLYTDWSDHAVGYVLKDDKQRPVLWNSRACNDMEKKYSSFLGELSAAHWALSDSIKIWRGAPVTLCSDSKSFITHFPNVQKSTDSRVLRRADFLLSIPNLQLRFTPGVFNSDADFMSRMKPLTSITKDTPSAPKELNSMNTTQKQEIIKEAHAAHFSYNTTYLNLKAMGYKWKGMSRDVMEYCKRCKVCQRFGRRKQYDNLGTHITNKPNELIAMDIIGPLKQARYQHKYIITCIDALTRFSHAMSFKKNSAENCIKTLEKWIQENGKPAELLVDNGSHFKAADFQNFCGNNEIQITFTPTYSHKSAGLIEKFNKTLSDRIMRIAEEKKKCWNQVLEYSIKEINRSVHLVTGFEPCLLMKGESRDGKLIPETKLQTCWKVAKARTEEFRRKANERYSKSLNKRNFNVDSLVWYFDSKLDQRLDAKFQSRWIGPCRIIKQHSTRTWDIILPDARKKFKIHSDFLKLYYD